MIINGINTQSFHVVKNLVLFDILTKKVWQRLIDRIPMYIHVCKGCNFGYQLPSHQNRFPRRALNGIFRRAQIWSLSRKHLIRLRVYVDSSGL